MNVKHIVSVFVFGIILILGVMLCAVSCDFIKFVDDTPAASDSIEKFDEPDESDGDSVLTESLADETTEAPTEPPKVLAVNPKFNEYLEINEDVVGNIRIPNTIINFLVLYNGDNDFYLNHSIYKKEDAYGSIFMDCTNHGAILNKNTIIHGHNFADGKIFADVENFKQKEFFDNNKTIIFNNLYSDMEWEVFAVYVVHSDDYFLQSSFRSDEDFFKFIEKIKSVSIFWRDYTPSSDDYILSVHTCSYEYEKAHTIVQAKLVSKVDNWEE